MRDQGSAGVWRMVSERAYKLEVWPSVRLCAFTLLPTHRPANLQFVCSLCLHLASRPLSSPEPNPLKIQLARASFTSTRSRRKLHVPAELYARAVPTLLHWKDRPLESTLQLCHAPHDPSHAISRLCSRPGVSPLHVRLSFRLKWKRNQLVSTLCTRKSDSA